MSKTSRVIFNPTDDELLEILRDAGYRVSVPCRRCGHPLTADHSVDRRLGPSCARREAA
ncbi:DUF6011 domain-containing protein [Jongsikchunia kroppenstedtii]|uniref:DUF6011 domain-containing protein n=1 Tax=Jongsikchunia kroppenstedtii TaxID=1121721 RepID=UPI001C9D6AE1